ncbi:uncharacterized protein [Rutidosis leptorrhynchoides]|uniref:uncharacterized protein n=1 Tax=Rutidosis leptorrhynchoides TaxID=125765 RepID=UPI003A992C84
MGQIVRRKRRGRPANTDRAHRNTSVTPPSPVDRRSSRRRRNVRYNFDIDDYVDDDEFYNNYEDDEDVVIGKKEKKIRLSFLEDDDSRSNRRVPHSSHSYHAPPSSSEDNEDGDADEDDDDEFNPLKKRNLDEEDNEIEEIRGRKLDDYDDDDNDNDDNNDDNEEEEEEEAGGSDYDRGTGSDRSKMVPLPDKRTLELILDKLQKKDIYGVYAEPVDPDELPDYHDVIKHPMDFATVRKKLAKGSYLTLKEFESDIYLICSNAMQYNAPDTIYYKQASSIQEQAKLRFKRLKDNVDRSEIEHKTERKTLPSFSLPKKQLKKTVGSETFSGSTYRTGELLNGSSAQTPARQNSFSDSIVKTREVLNGSSGQTPVRQNSFSGSVVRTNELPSSSGQTPARQNSFSGSIVRTKELRSCSSAQTLVRQNSCDGAEDSSLHDENLDKDQEQELLPEKGFVPKLERKPSILDENRRATYNIDLPPITNSDSVLSTFEGESKQLIPVGLHVDLSYARSLSRFAATLGSAAWKVASHTIEQALPEGVQFGRGWVGEYEPLPTPVPIPENRSNFVAHFNIPSDIKRNEKTSTFKHPDNYQAPKTLVTEKKLNDGLNPGFPVKQEAFRETSKDLSPNLGPRPPLFSSLQTKPAISGPNLVHQNVQAMNFTRPEKMGPPPQVELNHPPPIHASPADFVARKPVSNPFDVSSPRPSNPVSRNGNLASFASSKQPNSNNDVFAPGNPTPVAMDYNRMVRPDNNFTRQHEQQVPSKGKPTPVAMDYNKMVHPDSNFTRQPEQQVPSKGNPTPIAMDYNRMVRPDDNFTRQSEQQFPSKGNPTPIGMDYNRMVGPDNNFARQHEQQVLSDPVQMMKMLAKKSQHQQNNSNGFAFGLKREDSNNSASTIQQFHPNSYQIGPRREDSSNVALTAAQQWMSLGAGGFVKPPLTENLKPHKQQPQVSRFHGEFPVPGVQIPPIDPFTQQVRMMNEAQVQFQNRNVSFPQMVPTDLSRLQVQSSWRGVNPQMMIQQQQQPRPKVQESRPPDLNIGYQSIGSPVRQSGGMSVDSQQPDLALQL